MLYNYPSSTYQLKSTVESVSFVVGLLALVLVLLGLLSPVGKFTIVQSLTVIQMVFFGAVQF